MLLFLISALSAAGCTQAPSNPSPTPAPPLATTDPSTPVPASATSEPLTARLWVDPAVPLALVESASLVEQLGDLPVEWVDDRTRAHVRLEPNPERPLTRWTYAVVAPFPSIDDELSLQELRQAWAGSGASPPVYVTEQVKSEMAPLLGDGSQARIAQEGELLADVWEARDAYSVIPFESLEPRWKVLRLNGTSPLDRAYDAQLFPLSISYGLSGDPELMVLLEPRLDWPNTNRDPGKMTSLLMTGVSALVRATAWRMDQFGVDYPGIEIAQTFQEADITHVSHESAFSLDCPRPDPAQTSLRFCSAPRHLPLFSNLGVDLIELSGNHLADYGNEALLYTMDLYEQNAFATFAGGRELEHARLPSIVEHNGNRIALIGCNAAGPAYVWAKEDRPGALSCNDVGLMGRVRGLAEEGYLVVFTYQWPESDSSRPLPNQIEAFRSAIDSGAIIVNGSQAHRPQSMEFYGGGFIHYGLGNLFFDQMQALPLRQEFLDRHIFYDGRHISTELITAMLVDFAQPRPMTENERRVLLEEIFAVSGW